MWWIIFLSLLIWFALWVTVLRPWLKKQTWGWSIRFFKWIEPVEIWLWSKSETLLWSRFLIVIGILPEILQQIQILNVPTLIDNLPDQYKARVMIIFVVIGVVQEILRHFTTKPVAVVAVPDAAPTEVKEAVAKVEQANAEAVVAVAVAKSTPSQ